MYKTSNEDWESFLYFIQKDSEKEYDLFIKTLAKIDHRYLCKHVKREYKTRFQNTTKNVKDAKFLFTHTMDYINWRLLESDFKAAPSQDFIDECVDIVFYKYVELAPTDTDEYIIPVLPMKTNTLVFKCGEHSGEDGEGELCLIPIENKVIKKEPKMPYWFKRKK